jgi:hypothetical protein
VSKFIPFVCAACGTEIKQREDIQLPCNAAKVFVVARDLAKVEDRVRLPIAAQHND